MIEVLIDAGEIFLFFSSIHVAKWYQDNLL